VDITNPENGEIMVSIQSLAEKEPDPGDPSLVEPIPDGEYEPINVNDFENTIQPGQDTVITLDTQTDTYLAIPESDTVVVGDTPGTTDQPVVQSGTIDNPLQFQMYLGFTSQPLVINSNSGNPWSMEFDTVTGLYDIFNFVAYPESSTFQPMFIAIGV